MRIIAISGSLRADSLNTRLAHAAAGLVPAGVEIEVVTLQDIPLYDEDLRNEGWPAAVTTLGERPPITRVSFTPSPSLVACPRTSCVTSRVPVVVW